MNVVFLSDCGPFDVFLFRAIRQRHPGAAVVRVSSAPAMALTPRRRKELRRAPVQSVLRAVERRLCYRGLRRRIDRQVSRELFGSPEPPALGPCLEVRDVDVNAPATQQVLRSLAPDVLIVSSAPLLVPAVYSLARWGAVNVHRGIAPAYRGESTLFWPLYWGDYRNLGVTIHYLDQGIDTGRVLAQGLPDLEPGDSEATLLAKCARLAADLLLEYLDTAERRPAGHAPAGKSRLCLARDRRIWHDVRLWLRRRVLRRAIPPQAGARRIYF
jgi:methionyl-tRNA formyltransferase